MRSLAVQRVAANVANARMANVLKTGVSGRSLDSYVLTITHSGVLVSIG